MMVYKWKNKNYSLISVGKFVNTTNNSTSNSDKGDENKAGKT